MSKRIECDMLNEMVSAPVPQGLFKGTSGFCPVAVSKGMPKELIQLLADLGKRQYEITVANQSLGREIFSHLPLTIKGRSMHLLARGIQMPNEDPAQQKFVVHQLLLENVRDMTAGPAWVLTNDKGWINQWNHEPQFLESREIDNCSLSPRICETWAKVTGDAGWAGVALEAWQRQKPFALVIPPTMPSRVVLELFVEAQSLMDQHLRWRLPISIAAWHPSKDLQRMWVAYQAGSREAINSLRASDRVSLDISRKLEPATNSFSQVAKAGAWARFSQVEGVSSPKTPDNKPSPSPMFEGAVSKSDIVGLPLPSSSPGPAEAKRPLGVLPKAKGNSAVNKLKKRMTARQIIPWIKRGLAIAALLAIIFGVWKGAAFVKDFAMMVDSTIQSNSGDLSSNKKTVSADDGKNDGANSTKIFDKQKDATPPTDVNPPTDGFDTTSGRALALSESAGRRLLNQLQSDFPAIEFPVKESDQSFMAFSIPGSESLLTSLGFGLATPHQFFRLKLESQGNIWSLNHDAGEQGLFHGNLSSTSMADENGKSRNQFSWNWQAAPEAGLASEIKSGSFVVWLHESPEILATIPLSLPASGNPPSLLDALYEGMNFKAHLFEELARPETASKIKWLAEPIGINDPALEENGSSAVADQLWVVTSQAGNTCVRRLNEKQLLREITESVAGKSNEQNEKTNNAIQTLIEKIAPIQLQIRMDSPKYVDANSEMLVTKATATLFMKGEDGSMSSVIFYHEVRSREDRDSRKQEFERSINERLIRWLATTLNLDVRLVDAITVGKSYSPKSKATAEELAKAAFAKKFVQLISQELDRKMMFRAVRSTELMAESRVITVAIPAYQTNE